MGQQIPMQLVAGSPPGLTHLFEDSIGRLWVASSKGVHYFDGSRFFSLESVGVPTTAQVMQFAEDRNSSIWIATNEGLFRYEGGRAERITAGVVQSVVSIGDGVAVVALGTAPAGMSQKTELARVVKSPKWAIQKMFGVESQGQMSQDRAGNILFACAPGWCEVKSSDVLRGPEGSRAAEIVRHFGIKTEANHAQVIRDQAGCVWVGLEDKVVYQCPGETKGRELPGSVVAHGQIHISERSDGTIAIFSNSKLAIGRPGSFVVFGPANGIVSGTASAFGRDGTLWVGENRGLYRISYPARLEFWTEREGMLAASSVARFTKSGETYAGAVGGLLQLAQDRKSWKLMPGTEDLRRVEGLKIEADGKSMLAGLPAFGAAIFDSSGKRIAMTSKPSFNAWHFAQTKDGTVWTGGNRFGKLQRLGDLLTIVMEPLPGPENANALDLEVERQSGTLWGCYAGGLVRKAGTEWIRITTAEGLQQDSCRSLAPTPDGKVWYGYNTVPGFSVVEPGSKVQVKHFGTSAGVGQGRVHFLDVDSRGWLWRGSNDGIHVADSRMAESGQWLHLDASDGLPRVDMNQQAFYSDPDGSVWWGAENTLAHFRPDENFLNMEESPKFYLSGVAWDKQADLSMDWAGAQKLPHGTDLKFQLGSLDFHGRKLIEFRYRISPVGAEAAQEWKSFRGFEFDVASPAWGEQVLEVQGRFAPFGKWSGIERRNISVERPIWASWPALGTSAVGLLGVGMLWRRRNRMREEEVLPDLADWRMAALMPEAHELIGVTLDGRFRADRIVARGGFATVLAGVDLSAKEPVASAIKVFRPELNGEWLNKRFGQEVSALLSVQHPNVVRILGHGWTPSGTPYLAMEFIDGATLRQFLEAKAPLDRKLVGSYIHQIGSALAVIHKLGIYHRDLKPDNIMLRSSAATDQELVLIDFSIAIVRDPDQTIHGLSRAAGTLLYMAPEQAIGYACAASDIYSLTKVLLELLTGKTAAELFPDAAMDLPERVRIFLRQSLKFGLSEESILLMAQALEFDPMIRPADALYFVAPIVRDLIGNKPLAS